MPATTGGPMCRSTPRAVEKRIERVDDADVFSGEPTYHEVCPDIAIWEAEFLGVKGAGRQPAGPSYGTGWTGRRQME